MPIPGSNIRLLRGQLGLSLKSLALAADIDQGNLSKLERGETGYSREVIERIAKVLHVSVGVLFAETAQVEAAALDSRIIPVLSPEQLMRWKGADSIPFEENQRYLRADLSKVSRHSFGLLHLSDGDSPWFLKGDVLIFDASRQPTPDCTVAAQDQSCSIFIGRLRRLSTMKADSPAFEVIPLDPRQKAASTDTNPSLKVRGVLGELHRYYPPV